MYKVEGEYIPASTHGRRNTRVRKNANTDAVISLKY